MPATRKKIPLIPTDSALTIGAGKTLSTAVNLDVSGADVAVVGSGTAVITFPAVTGTLAKLTDITGTNSGTNTGDQTLPVKATGAEITTGTDDAKFVTAKAIADSRLVNNGALPAFLVRAWVQFTGGTTTQTINGSGNIASVVRNSTGQCTITFTNAMPDDNYAVFVSSSNGTSDGGNADYCLSRAVGSCVVRHLEAGTAREFVAGSVIIVR